MGRRATGRCASSQLARSSSSCCSRHSITSFRAVRGRCPPMNSPSSIRPQSFFAAVDRVEVRRGMALPVHVDDDPVELAEPRHSATVRIAADSQSRAAQNNRPNGHERRSSAVQNRRQVCERRVAPTKPANTRPTCETCDMELAEGIAVDDEQLGSFCAEHGIRSLRLFGSALHGTLRPDSDIDLLVEFEPECTPGLLSMAQLELELGELLGRQVDLRTLHDLSCHFRDQVAAEARTVYDAA